jgi:plastocyanin
MRVKGSYTWVLAAFLAATTVACSGGSPAPAPNTPPPNAKRVDEATAGNITGKVTFEGTPPVPAQIKVDSDPACAKEHPNGLVANTLVVDNGGLENVFVYVKDGLGDYYFETPTTPVTLDQKGCRYTPHVFGVRAGQPVEIVNSDPTLHNVNAMAKVNRPFNMGQAIQGMKSQKTFATPEVMVHIKCDVHNWMNAYAGVLNHPYFAVTANGGSFELKGLPPGTYTVEAWHEKLGTQTQSVTVGSKEDKAINFAFKTS